MISGIERDLKKSKLLLDCVLIITSVVPPELPMELSLAVNASLVALSKFGKALWVVFSSASVSQPLCSNFLYRTIPYSICRPRRCLLFRQDWHDHSREPCLRRSCWCRVRTFFFYKMYFFSHSSISSSDHLKLVNVKATSRETTLCLAGAHALVRLDDGTVVGDPMEKATLEALEWQIGNGDGVAPAAPSAPHRTVVLIRRRFQFSSALKRMSTVSTLPGGRGLVAVKGAPETLKTMLAQVPSDYDETYKWYTRRGSRVLALGMKEYDSISMDRVRTAV